MNFNKDELEYINRLLSTALKYPNNAMAIEDAIEIAKVLNGEKSRHFTSILSDNIGMIEDDAYWSINSREDVTMMIGILDKVLK